MKKVEIRCLNKKEALKLYKEFHNVKNYYGNGEVEVNGRKVTLKYSVNAWGT